MVDRPCVQGPSCGVDVPHEAAALVGSDEGVEGHVEADVGEGQEVAGVGEGVAYVDYGVVGEGFARGFEDGGLGCLLVRGDDGLWCC